MGVCGCVWVCCVWVCSVCGVGGAHLYGHSGAQGAGPVHRVPPKNPVHRVPKNPVHRVLFSRGL